MNASAETSDYNQMPVYELYETIEENAKRFTKLARLKALDLDKNRNISFSIASNNLTNLIEINQITGELFVNGQIDYETTKWINLTVIATDNGEPSPKSAILNYYGRVEDVNDNEPKFLQMNTTEFGLHENAEPNTRIAQFRALDADSGIYGTVFYRILRGDEGKFHIDPLSVSLIIICSLFFCLN